MQPYLCHHTLRILTAAVSNLALYLLLLLLAAAVAAAARNVPHTADPCQLCQLLASAMTR
jgi:hypothetical protein